jgi:hypothetical protein
MAAQHLTSAEVLLPLAAAVATALAVQAGLTGQQQQQQQPISQR